MEDLKPCPFCGGENIAIDRLGDQVFDVTCWDCRAGTGGDVSFGPEAASRLDALKTWNTRV